MSRGEGIGRGEVSLDNDIPCTHVPLLVSLGPASGHSHLHLAPPTCILPLPPTSGPSPYSCSTWRPQGLLWQKMSFTSQRLLRLTTWRERQVCVLPSPPPPPPMCHSPYVPVYIIPLYFLGLGTCRTCHAHWLKASGFSSDVPHEADTVGEGEGRGRGDQQEDAEGS